MKQSELLKQVADILAEASDIISTLQAAKLGEPVAIRGAIVDELDGFSGMLRESLTASSTEVDLPAEYRSGNDIPVTRAVISAERMKEIIREASMPEQTTLLLEVARLADVMTQHIIDWGSAEAIVDYEDVVSLRQALDKIVPALPEAALLRVFGGQ